MLEDAYVVLITMENIENASHIMAGPEAPDIVPSEIYIYIKLLLQLPVPVPYRNLGYSCHIRYFFLGTPLSVKAPGTAIPHEEMAQEGKHSQFKREELHNSDA